MSSCTVFVFLSLIEYAFVNVMMGDISEVERKDKASQLRNIIVATNSLPYMTNRADNRGGGVGDSDEHISLKVTICMDRWYNGCFSQE